MAFLLAWLAFQTADIDAFMEKVLQRRDVNWADYYDYSCRETAELSIDGSIPGVPLSGFRHEYLWYVRDGYLVRSPLSADGVRTSDDDRDRAELEWIEDAKEREAEEKADRERFFAFEFEPGNYFFAGTQEFEGRNVVAVEYYPENAFTDEEDDDEDDEVERAFNKALGVTLLVDPDEHQIVRMTIENFGFDFLPAGWLVKLDTVEASLTMHQPFAPEERVWLVRDMEFFGKVRTASGDLAVRYRSTFGSCVKAEVKVKYRFPPRPRKKGS